MRSLRSSARAFLTKKEATLPAKFVIVEYVEKSNTGDRVLFEIVAVNIIRGSHSIDSRVSYLPPSTKSVNGGARKMRRGKIRGQYATRSDAQAALQRFEDEQEQQQDGTLENDGNVPSTSTTTRLLAAAILQEKEINNGLDAIPALDLNINVKMETDTDFLYNECKPKSALLGPPTLINEGGLDADREDYNGDIAMDGELSAQLNADADDDEPDRLQMEGENVNNDSAADANLAEWTAGTSTSTTPPPSLTPIHRFVAQRKQQTNANAQWGSGGAKPTLAEALANIQPTTANTNSTDGSSVPPTVRQILSAVMENQLLIMKHLGTSNDALRAAEQKTSQMLLANNAVNLAMRPTPMNGRNGLRPVKFMSSTTPGAPVTLRPLSASFMKSNHRRLVIANATTTQSGGSGETKKFTLGDALRMPALRVMKPGPVLVRISKGNAPNPATAADSADVEEARPRTSATASIASTTPICLSHFQNGMPLLKDSTSPEMEFDDKPCNDNDDTSVKEEDEVEDNSSNIFSDLPPLKPETL